MPRQPRAGLLRVHLEDGSLSSFAVATPEEPGRWLSESCWDFAFGTPSLFVSRMEKGTVRRAIEAMAHEMGGYWLRYYNSRGRVSWVGRTLGSPGGGQAEALRVVSVALTEAYPPRRPAQACGVVQVRVSDGREFSLLAATPAWFERAFSKFGLEFYFGPLVLFVGSLEPLTARRAARAMAAQGDLWFCLYDTPRTTLPQVLAAFKSRHE